MPPLVKRVTAAMRSSSVSSLRYSRRCVGLPSHSPVTRWPPTTSVQDTLLRAWRSRDRFEPGTNLEAWTFTILRNAFYRSRRKARDLQDEDGSRTARLATLPDQAGHLDLQDVRSAIERLAPMMREALILVAIENLTHEEAAAVMNCRIGTVKSRVWRAREQLARMLGYTGTGFGSDG
jgi:RNA polymerase sigma-70 factor (ECF subfamily)